MTNTVLMDFRVDTPNRQIRVDRQFHAPLDLVWAAWTQPEILDQWWAPKPWKTQTKNMQFAVGGHWHYAMVGPEGETHWCLFEYDEVQPQLRFGGLDAFCDEHAVISDTKPRMHWSNTFEAQGDSTTVHVQIDFDKLADLEAIIQMGFKEGFTMGLENLDHYISMQFYLRKQYMVAHQGRVSTYLNFAGNTEEAFEFYRSAFRTEFTAPGIQRFGDLPPDPNQPPIADALKRMVIHVELPILGGHILMGTDAPKEMGFTVSAGNNMHINLEPVTRAETDRLFGELSAGGTVSMPLQDMFWGAYFGSFTDKYGISWMLNCQEK